MREIILNKDYKAIHFIGIGGVNMNCLALLLHSRGYVISGSDQNESSTTRLLQDSGITVFIGHKKEAITNNIDLVVYTAAVQQDNIELRAAIEAGIPTMDRAALLGFMMKNYKRPICVAGTHGKTTTTSMFADAFLSTNTDPTILVGGHLESIGGNLRDGGMDYFIAESCEYFDSFLRFFPYIGVILNIEADHLDYFKDLNAVRSSFAKFARRVPASGAVVINTDIDNYAEIINGLDCRVITFGFKNADWTADNIRYSETGYGIFDAYFKGNFIEEIHLSVPGEHNILNALSVIASAHFLGLDMVSVAKGLKNFNGAKRRFQLKGVKNGVRIIDDYAHHPTEISKTIASAKNMMYNKLWCVFQPHTHSRTKALLNEFAACFDDADRIVILDIYSPVGREEPSTFIHSIDLVKLIEKRNKKVYYFGSFDKATDFLIENCLHNDMLITMGAGDVYLLGESILKSGI